MAKLDFSSNQLQTALDQNEAIKQVIDELNNLDEDSELLNFLNISAFGKMVLNSDSSILTGTQTVSAKHGLNYKPFYLVYLDFIGGGTSFLSVPYYALRQADDATLAFIFYSYVDSTNVYMNLQTYNDGLSGTFGVYYYIFNMPMPT